MEILPPPQATLANATEFWNRTVGLLKPHWSRWLVQPHLSVEVVASATGVLSQVWVPGIVPPGAAVSNPMGWRGLRFDRGARTVPNDERTLSEVLVHPV
ncbi:hypothetical protein [Nocardiopsis sp. FIRDI 009]|uniref:hypothetical protein n=1 Tax=Nocardiopsis sp. FIRDI 009 TaxID=714197 RepID=UPI0013002B2E|nr:hypothetical protein [Nocardiopsis sp. FIRDI 009]